MAHRAGSLDKVDRLVARIGFGPWTLSEVVGTGWTRSEVRAAVAAGRLVRLRRGVFAAGRDDALARSRAALLVSGERAALSHESAAAVHGMWVPSSSPVVHITAPGIPDSLHEGTRNHGSRLPDELVTTVDGVRVTTLARTAVDLARRRSFPDALIALDGGARLICLRELGGTCADLRNVARRAPLASRALELLHTAYGSVLGWPGTAVVRRALPHADPASESPFESLSRGWIPEAGLPAPAVAVLVHGASGATYYADLAWLDRGVLGEADGTSKYGTDPSVVLSRLRDERRRQRDLEDAGWTVVRWDSTEARQTVVTRIRHALATPRRESLPEWSSTRPGQRPFGQ